MQVVISFQILGDNLVSEETCLWTGTPWVGKDLPKPLDDKVYMQNRDKMQVYVR